MSTLGALIIIGGRSEATRIWCYKPAGFCLPEGIMVFRWWFAHDADTWAKSWI